MDYSIFPKQDVVERLEAAKRSGGLCKEAAAEIRQLRAEVARLTNGLQHIANNSDRCLCGLQAERTLEGK